MRHNLLKLFLFAISLAVFACAQDPARVIIHPTTSPAKGGFTSNNPYKTIVQKGDTLYSIAHKHNVEIRDVIETNGLRPPYTLIIGQSLKLPTATFHTVSDSDNLYAISRSYGVDISRLAKKNNLIEPYHLTAGQKLLLPSPAEKDADSSAIAKTEKYNFITKERQISDSKVSSSNLAELDTKPSKSVSNYSDSSPFPLQKTDSAPLVLSKKSPALSTHSEDNDEAFQYNSEQEFAADSTKLDESAPIETNQKIPPAKSELTSPKKNNITETLSSENSKSDQEKAKATVKDLSDQKIAAQKISSEITNNSPFAEDEDSPSPSSRNSSSSTKPDFYWPVKGSVISKFGPKKGGLYNDGINISAKEGTPIKASDDGEVVYAGNELRGYGNMLLIKHNSGYLTAYAHADDFLVKKGDLIKKGQVIAHVGQTGHVTSPQLHFSIRQGRKAIDPEKYLSSS